ncbi:MAG: hypothetical protein OIN66_10890 [Candidatus Methanoperedens sp.]|nr:hypothetical protein [Candidatus Methanoperedens sp.]
MSHQESGNTEEASVTVNYDTRIIIHNLTARRIGIKKNKSIDCNESQIRKDDLGLFVLPPFGKGTFKSEELDYESWQQLNLIRIEKLPKEDESSSEALYFAFGASIIILIIAAILRAVGSFFGYFNKPDFWLNVWGIIALIVVLSILYKLKKEIKERFIDGLKNIRQWGALVLSLILILAIGVGLPALVIFFFGGGKDLLTQTTAVPSPDMLGRGMQFVFIATVSLLPALMYFLFTHQKLGTLQVSFFREIVQLDPRVITLEDARSLYEDKVRSVYGAEESSSSRLYGVQSPIFVATLIITVGWILTLHPFGDISRAGDFFMPSPTPIVFGFLGAYFFGLNMLFRRYARVDLRPKAYSHITVRILMVIILVWVLSEIPMIKGNNSVLLPLAFMIGIFPATAIAIIQEYLQTVIKNRFYIKEEKTLEKLDGINFYQRTQLVEEGVENIENLANYDLIDLMLQTRIPVPCLVDWVDQAILYLHLDGSEDIREGLRAYGIRTATDLIRAYEVANKRGDGRGNILLEQLEEKIEKKTGTKDIGAINRFKVILDTLEDDEWMAYIKHWRDTRHTNEIFTIGHFKNELRPMSFINVPSSENSQLSPTPPA